jgi:hypothetical protein
LISTSFLAVWSTRRLQTIWMELTRISCLANFLAKSAALLWRAQPNLEFHSCFCPIRSRELNLIRGVDPNISADILFCLSRAPVTGNLEDAHRLETNHTGEMLIDRERKVAFVHVPKAAGTSVTEWLLKTSADPGQVTVLKGWVTSGGNKMDVMHGNWESLSTMLLTLGLGDSKEDRPWTFAIVRHPYERICSAFHEMSNNGGWASQWGRMPFANVNAFVAHLAAHPKEIHHNKFIHIRPNHWFTHTEDGKAAVDSIFQYDRLHEAIQTIATQLKIDISQHPFPELNVRIRKTSVRAEQLLSAVSRAAIDNLYADDYRIFGFTPI